MTCKKHLQDLTSTVGVCASCLRERLEAHVQAQSQAQAQPVRVVPRSSDELRKPEPNPPPLTFPRSVSPYVSCRKSDRDRRLDRLFYSTPQVGPGFSSSACDGGRTGSSKKRLGKFWILSYLFQSRSNKHEISSRESCDPTSSSSAASPSRFSMILPARRQNHHEDSPARGRRLCQQPDRGIPTENSNSELFNGLEQSYPGIGCLSEESPQRRLHHTPPSVKRSRLGSAGKSLSGMVICLSPLVRASPNRHWSQKGLTQELGAPVVGGAHNHIPTAASFCTNRSRKLADFGKVSHNL